MFFKELILVEYKTSHMTLDSARPREELNDDFVEICDALGLEPEKVSRPRGFRIHSEEGFKSIVLRTRLGAKNRNQDSFKESIRHIKSSEYYRKNYDDKYHGGDSTYAEFVFEIPESLDEDQFDEYIRPVK